MTAFILWYLGVTFLGWITFPIAFRIFSHFKDRGFGFAKVLGLLIWSYTFWLLNILQIGQNSIAGLLLALFALLIVSGLCLRNGFYRELRQWIRAHRQMILFVELLFFFLFAFWTLVRATNPDITGTEKPMELAFVNAILKSPQFPPRDPWLSGYAISYYYFGYVMIAMLIKITGVASWVGFNLGASLWFSLTAVAVFSLVFSLISKHNTGQTYADTSEVENGSTSDPISNLFWSLLGPLFLLILSNVEGFLEMLHARGIFWKQGENDILQSNFWTWLDIQELVQPPSLPFGWIPERTAGIWWWRASRVLQDYTASGQSREIIDEFPFFSFLLSDLHPHVLAMPFALLAIAFALNYYFSYRLETEPTLSLINWLQRWFKGQAVQIQQLTLSRLVMRLDFWIIAFLSGSLAFLNTWDFPIYVGLFAAVYTYKRTKHLGWNGERLLEFLGFGLLTGIFGILLFLPFYFGFSSQAGGFLPSLFFFTRGIHFWVMFLPLLLPIIWWLISAVRKTRMVSVVHGFRFSLIVLAALWILSYLIGALVVSLPAIGQQWIQIGQGSFLGDLASRFENWGALFFGVQGISQSADLWKSIGLRLLKPGTWITLGLLMALVWAILDHSTRNSATAQIQGKLAGNQGETLSVDFRPFISILVLLGAGLAIFPEFFYLRDQFGWRINTIFKFYFQTWILWSIAAAATSVWLLRSLKGISKILLMIIWSAVLIMGLAYPIFGLQMKLGNLQIEQLSLNGARHIEQFSVGEFQAIQWLLDAPDGILLEAVGGSYSGFARISAYTGLPTVLGWPGHESQWRGGADEMGTREADIRQIYQSTNWQETLDLLRRYQIRYIYIGTFERNTYRVNDIKFQQNLEAVFDEGSVIIFEVPEVLIDPRKGSEGFE